MGKYVSQKEATEERKRLLQTKILSKRGYVFRSGIPAKMIHTNLKRKIKGRI